MFYINKGYFNYINKLYNISNIFIFKLIFIFKSLNIQKKINEINIYKRKLLIHNIIKFIQII